MLRHSSRLLASALLLAALAGTRPACCLAQGDASDKARAAAELRQQRRPGGGRSLLAADNTQQDPQLQQQEQHEHAHDITVEEAILQTYAPDSEKKAGAQQAEEAERAQRHAAEEASEVERLESTAGATKPGTVQQQEQQEQHAPDDSQQQAQQGQARARQLRQAGQERQRLADQDKADQEAEHSRHLERQRKQAAAARERRAAQVQAERKQQALGRGGALRSARKPLAGQQQPVSGSRKDDIFAQHMERKLTATRARLAEQRVQQAVTAQVAARAAHGAAAGQQGQGGQAGGAAGAAGAGAKAGSVHSGRRRHQSIPLPIIIFMTLGMAAAAGLGALPFFFVRSMSDAATGVATAIACGVMLAASFDLVHEGQPYGAALTVAGLLLGGWFIRWVQHLLEAYENISFGSLQGSSARKTVLMVGIMAAHALGEGCAVGVSFCGERGWAQGVLTTLAIGVHNIPEGLAKATVLVGQGVSARRALLWSVATCLPQPLVAVPSFIFVEAFTMILPVALGFAAGCMIWMVFAELLPDALERTDGGQVATAATMSAAGLEGFRMFFASLEQADGSFGGGVAAAHAAGVLTRMGPPLLVLLPAVAVAAAGGGALGGSAIPAPVAWGVAAAVALSSAGGALLDQLLWRPQVPTMHTLAAGAVGAVLAVLLHRQLLHWADASAASLAARKLHLGMHKERRRSNEGSPGGRHSAPDVEALEFASMYQQHNLHHHPAKSHHHPHTHPLPMAPGLQQAQQHQHQHHQQYLGSHVGAPQAVYMEGAGGSMNGFGGSSSSLQYQAPYHRGGASTANGSSAAMGQDSLPSGATTPSGFGMGGAYTPVPRTGLGAAGRMPAGQLAAAATVVLALGAGAVASGWHLAGTLLLLSTDRSSVLLPAALLLLAGPGLGAGALARTMPSRSGASAGAWVGGALAGVAALSAALAAARAHESAHTAALIRRFFYPFGITDTAEALAGGALCAAAWIALAAGSALKPPSARGGLALGLAVTGLLAGLRLALCSFTPYCLSIHSLLQQA